NEGMVEVRPRHGMRVLPVSADDMAEIYQILTALESDAAAEIARTGLSPEELAALKGAVEEMEDALAADDLKAWARADGHFHTLLIEACRNKRLRALVYQFWDQTYRVRMLTLTLRPRPTDSNRDHHALVDAIERRDPEAAACIHREHRLRAGAMLVSLLRNGPPQPSGAAGPRPCRHSRSCIAAGSSDAGKARRPGEALPGAAFENRPVRCRAEAGRAV